MAFTIHPTHSSHFHQRLRNLGPGTMTPYSDVKVYQLKRGGTRGKLLRIENVDKDGRRIR